ncbi:CRIB domain-containing protein RIC6-like [Lotus japonicus]|uniref:CRIB domain-containing protein RIC6-like n=1 Tax=Lotus japonicus TaxID=34305 RepID=UPI0025853455|nr:CRIB domain-containing protein RIC6-like [Lotus japonicus]
MSGNKVKGLLKGLRYISQIFENDKDQDIQIGYPTDVKHVAHIGWDGPSVNTPSWMNEYKSSPGFASAPLNLNGDAQNKGQDNSVKWISEDSRRSRPRLGQGEGMGRDLPDLPKGSRRQSTGNMTDSPSREKSRQSKKSSHKSSSLNKEPQGEGSPAPDIPKKTRRKKSKENSGSGGGSSKSRSKGAQHQDPSQDYGSASQPVSESRIS